MRDIALLGVGLMGRPMAKRLMGAGYRLVLFNRTKSKILDMGTCGAVIADSPQEAVSQAQTVILMLTDYQAIEDILFRQETLEFSDRTFIQMATILPEESRQLKRKIEHKGGAYFECPVLGSRDKAETGELILMAGSTQEQFERYRPVLESLGHSVRRVGEVGQAAALKLALNQLIVSLVGVFSLSLGMVLKGGVRVDDFMEILRESVLYAPTFDKKLPRMLADDFSNPNFPIRHMLKDVRLILEYAGQAGLDVSVLEPIQGVLVRAMDGGLAGQDYSAIAKIIQAQL